MSTNEISIDLKTGIFNGKEMKVRIRDERGLVVMFIDRAKIEFRTPAAYKAGFLLVKKANEALPGEFVNMIINNQDVELLPPHAEKIGAALLRRSESADDFQQQRIN